MGWASGSELAENIWNLIKPNIPKKKRAEIAVELVQLFEDADCDTICEVTELCEIAHGGHEEN